MTTALKSTTPIWKGPDKRRSWSPFRFLAVSALFALLGFNQAHGANIWDGGGADAKWNTANNWDNNTVPLTTADVTFATAFTSGTAIDLNGNRTVNSLTINTTTAFSFNNNTLTLTTGNLTRSAASGTTTINSNVTIAGSGVWDITGTLLVTGGIGDSGTQSMTKSGTGKLTMTSSGTWGGDLTINGGTVELSGSAGKLGGGSNTLVTVNTGGTLLLNGTNVDQVKNGNLVVLNGGTLALGPSMKSTAEVFSTLTLTDNSIIDFGSLASGAILDFANSNAVAWTAGKTLSIYNWTSGTDHIDFSSATGLTSTQLAQIRFYSDGGSTFLGTGSIVQSSPFDVVPVAPVVPEPSTVLVGLGLLSLAGYRERRWFLRCREARRK